MKRKICLITNWYPSESAPRSGLFFKEQALAVSDQFDFVVVHYALSYTLTGIKRNSAEKINKDQNITEYRIKLYLPAYLFLFDIIDRVKLKLNKRPTIEGIGKYVSPKRKNCICKAINRLFDREINESFDALYCVDAQQEAFYVNCLAEHYGIPYIIGEHAPVPWPGTLLTDINRESIEKADAFFAISNDKIRQLMLQNIKLPEIVYIGNMINEDQFVANGNKNHIKTFIIIASYSFFKNYDLFISIINRLTKITEKQFKVIIAGYCPSSTYQSRVVEFEQKIYTSFFSDKAELLPCIPHDEMPNVINRADAFIMTSIQEGQPVSAIEAACCGLPIFSTRCGGVEDYVDDSIGRIYNITDVEGFANGLKDYLERRIAFDSEHIRQTVVRKFGKEAFRRTFIDSFNKVIDNAISKRDRDCIQS